MPGSARWRASSRPARPSTAASSPSADAEFRVQSCWKPYHERLLAMIAETKARFGACLLIDCHSMPAHASKGAPPDIVLGDAHGTACSGRVTQFVERTLSDLGYAVRRNDPYAGGYVTRHYGRPREGVHVLQIEIARRLYMDEALFSRREGFERVRDHLTALAAQLAAATPSLLDP